MAIEIFGARVEPGGSLAAAYESAIAIRAREEGAYAARCPDSG